MADFTYNAALSTPRDQVRFLTQDVDAAAPLFKNSEIDYALTAQTDTALCAAGMLEALAVRFAMRPDTVVIDGLSISNAQRAKMLRDLADDIRRRRRVDNAVGGIVLTGVSLGEMAGVDANADRPPSRFKIGQDDFQ